jgi:hypothetical protein
MKFRSHNFSAAFGVIAGLVIVSAFSLGFPSAAHAVVQVRKTLDSEDTSAHFKGVFSATGITSDDLGFHFLYGDQSGTFDHDSGLIETRLSTIPATTETTFQYEIDYATNSFIHPGTLYYYEIRDQNGTSYLADTFQPPAQSSSAHTANVGFYASFGQGTRTATSFTNTVTLTPTTPTQVSAQVIWGDTETSLTNAVGLSSSAGPVTQILLTNAETLTFTVDGLEAAKTYAYALSQSGDPDARYSTVEIIPVFTGSQTTTVSSGAPITITGPSLGAAPSADGSGGLVPCDGRTAVSRCGWATIIKLINTVIKFLIYFTIPLAAVVFAYAGVLLLTNGASEESRSKAKHIFLNVVIGLVIILAAVLVVTTILNALGVGDAYRSFL